MRCRIQEIVGCATPYTLFALDPRVVQELLDLHEAVYPTARHPRARELLRERNHGPYLRAIGNDLERAVRHGLLCVEPLDRGSLLVEREAPEERAPENPKEEETTTVKLQLVSQDGLAIPEVAFKVHFADGSVREGRLDRQGEATLRDAPSGAYEIEYLDFDQIRARAFAARAHRAIAQQEIPALLGILSQSSTLLRFIAAAYEAYFDDAGQGFTKAIKGVVAGTENEGVVEYFLTVGRVDPDAKGTVVAMRTPTPGTSGDDQGGTAIG
ncbi:hypothetical protein LZC95_31140 [Pendulispora brunnea]|uniref:Uncharacterized protein n=1 Tax=Pendulispora brunnea TaxID=2905690 RepID=A0ABZ2JWM6_9BACT